MQMGTVEIPLFGGSVAVVDAADLPLVAPYKWSLSDNGRRKYARGWIREKGQRRGRFVYMHRLIFGDDKFKNVDHRDGNSLNNTRANLRGCSVAENTKNKRVIRAISGFKGVTLQCPLHRSRPWRAVIVVDGRHVRLGYFATAKEAALAYDKAALKYHGDFAATNTELRP